MLHNNYLDVLVYYLNDFLARLHGRGVYKTITFSQKKTAMVFKEMESLGLLKSHIVGNLKEYSLNIDNTELKDYLIAAEIYKKILFLKKNRKLANIFKKDTRTAGIFGSYARGTQTSDSDIDIFIIGEKKEEDYDNLGKKYDLDINIVYFSGKNATKLLKGKNNLMKEIALNHVIIFNAESFVNLLWEYYYGFN